MIFDPTWGIYFSKKLHICTSDSFCETYTCTYLDETDGIYIFILTNIIGGRKKKKPNDTFLQVYIFSRARW